MSVLTAIEKAKECYRGLNDIQKKEITKLVTGAVRPERVILNPSTKEGRKNG